MESIEGFRNGAGVFRADFTFYASVEGGIIDNPELLRQHFIDLYVRFKDDILIILGGTRVSRLNFFTSLREQSSVWSLEVEHVSSSACNFLDLNIAKGAKWRSSGLLDVGIHHKPTGLHQPLAPHSAHSPNVHVAWPKGLLTRAKRLCNTKSLFHLEVIHLKRLLSARFGAPYADAVLSRFPKQPPSVARHDMSSRLILPYHKEWEFGRTQSVLHKVQERHRKSLMKDLGTSIGVQISFSLAAPHLYLRLAGLWPLGQMMTVLVGWKGWRRQNLLNFFEPKRCVKKRCEPLDLIFGSKCL